MLEQSELTYCYDGSFEGFLCCVFESFANKEMPGSILDPSQQQLTLFQTRQIVTDLEKAQRVRKSIPLRMGREAYGFLRQAFLTCLPEKEVYMLRFMRLGYEQGPRVMRLLANEVVHVLFAAVRFLKHEASNYKGFLRFSAHDGLLLASIEPKNYVLPFLGAHFRDRFPEEKFLIYDKSHHMVCTYSEGKFWVSDAVDIQLPEADEEEIQYRQLWRLFYDTIAIKERENPRCRMGHMPKRYWHCMTEFQVDEKVNGGGKKAASNMHYLLAGQDEIKGWFFEGKTGR